MTLQERDKKHAEKEYKKQVHAWAARKLTLQDKKQNAEK